jgi:hypothetical protein
MAGKDTSQFVKVMNNVYLIFFAIHIPAILFVDAARFYPASLKPAICEQIQVYYATNFRDRFFIDPPNWFTVYVAMEVLYHIPISVWMLPALRKGRPQSPILVCDADIDCLRPSAVVNKPTYLWRCDNHYHSHLSCRHVELAWLFESRAH